ncbi:nuclear transport factor 2 family protein [Rhodanobacter sp. DHB23]|uniref:nuclear transport factor 2 family protein n=1 Tax=Rhodanobacter sp. DHB23 TaxID=2775923 RepID=UPI0017868B94|nr:nuclear transport factor 2 family protein [Rhodanobacter sp. DHB23]MBD8874607.1 nuclear transport factor 2 family protein [Rhodanobacter sp. DHB23]
MRHPIIPSLLVIVPLLAWATATIAADPDETAHTAAAVKAVDQHWLEAETHGDAAWLDGMLLPSYRSIGADGKATPKAAIVAHAAKNRDAQAQEKMKQEVAAWQQAHPVEQQVVMQGDTAILSFVSSVPATRGKLYSSDVFVYMDGRWHALYSQHAASGKE